jgi:hypothetical protein
MAFDFKLAESSLKFYSLREVPAIRGPLPAGVSDVHFRSDVSGLPALSVESLLNLDEAFGELLASKER